ncbi:MAG: hypothetical protein ACXW20_22075, partial [Burkholderiales bacterium]
VAKLAAFNQRFLASAALELATAVSRASLDWNGLADTGRPAGEPGGIVLPPPGLRAAWQAHSRAWRTHLEALPDLTSTLRTFVQKRR